jgi:hypothetical protein
MFSQLQQPACVSLALSLQPTPTKLQRPGALLMQLSRMAEVWLAAEAGAANVRQWLLVSRQCRSCATVWQGCVTNCDGCCCKEWLLCSHAHADQQCSCAMSHLQRGIN